MASILSLRRRITAAQNVSKTTRAMQMIAASKFKRAQDAALASRPYVEKLTSLTENIVSKKDEKISHPYLMQKSDTGKSLLVVLSPDKGLCGGLITNLLREFLTYNQTNVNTSYIVIGKKVEGQVIRLNKEIIASFAFGSILPSFDIVYPIIKLIDDYYLTKKVDSVKILSTHFVNIFTQEPKVSTILPIVISQDNLEKQEYIFEPNIEEILPSLLKHYLEMNVYQGLLENFASEQAARMISMQNATNNAKEIITDLRLEYNKTRQAKITSELLDISGSGSEAGNL